MIKDIIMILEEVGAQDFQVIWNSIYEEDVTIKFAHRRDFVRFLRQYHFTYSDSHIVDVTKEDLKVVFSSAPHT